MSIVLQSTGGGSVTINEPTTASNFTQTLPAVTGTVVVSGTTPSLNGITFPATQVPSADANTLDDYEEGSWTPTDASGAGLSLTVNSARYTKIGRLVYVTFYISYPSTASAAQISIGGLPFTSSGGEVYCTGSLSTNAAITGFTRIGPSATTMQVFAISGSTSITNVQIAPNYAITSVTYITA